MKLTRRPFVIGTMAIAFVASFPAAHAQAGVSSAEARAVEGAYVYGFPMVASYCIQYDYFVGVGKPEYRGTNKAKRPAGC